MGGGGGSSDNNSSSGAAEASVRTSPNNIDVQDRTEVRISLKKVNRNGIVVKIKYPRKLEYVAATSFLKVDGEDKDVNPDVSASVDSKSYLAFFFPRSFFGDVSDNEDDEEVSSPGELRFELVGRERLTQGAIEIDVDVDDPTISNPGEFDPSSPAFQTESEASIEVED